MTESHRCEPPVRYYDRDTRAYRAVEGAVPVAGDGWFCQCNMMWVLTDKGCWSVEGRVQ